MTTSATAQQLQQLHKTYLLNQCQNNQWLTQVSQQFWAWLCEQPLEQRLSADNLLYFANQQVLSQSVNQGLRQDIRLISQAVIDHPINTTTKLADLIADTQVHDVAKYIANQDKQRNALIHEVIGNPNFAAMLSQTISHAMTDFMDNNLGKIAGVGKLVKFGKGALEKATNATIDDSLNNYLNKNISHLTAKTETIAQRHLNNQRMQAIIENSWQRVKNKPVAEVKKYLYSDSVQYSESIINQSYDNVRSSEFIRTQVTDAIKLWYTTHRQDKLGDIFTQLNIDSTSVQTTINDILVPLMADLSQSNWFAQQIDAFLTPFYTSTAVKTLLTQ